MTPKQGRQWRKELLKEIAREARRQQRQHLEALRQAIRDARSSRRETLAHAKASCRAARHQARQRASALRAQALLELREAVALERRAARESCASARAHAREHKDKHQRARAELAAERAFRAEMRRIERSNRARARELIKASARERQSESDDEVRGNIPPELVPLFDKVSSKIRDSARMTRTEAFLHYAEENPDEVLSIIEDRTEATLRELERQERRLAKAYRRRPSKKELAALTQEVVIVDAAVGDEVPF